ncbi:MAG: S9 family peptidase [Gammaproteobacteria bacterium]|nr:S9 family peptidase [Gammaproteobacteria bacterium]
MTVLTNVAAAAGLEYPSAGRGDHVDDFFGVRVPDPYRWMENIDSPQVGRWIRAENRLTRAYLEAVPGRAAIRQRLTRIWNYPRWSPPQRHGRFWSVTKNNGLQNQSVLYVGTGSPDAGWRVLLDPNRLSPDGTVALKDAAFSEDGRLMAYGLSDGGSDWEIWRVRDVATGKDLPDTLRWIKFAGATWNKDASGFFYSGYAAPPGGNVLKAANQYQKIYFHPLGQPQSADRVIYGRTDAPDWYVGAQVTDDGRYLLIEAEHGTDVRNTVLYEDLGAAQPQVVPLMAEPDAAYSFIGNVGSQLYFVTDKDAPRYRVIAVDTDNPVPAHWRTVVPENGDTIESAHMVGGQIVVRYMRDAHSAVARFAPDGKALGEVRLPGIGTVSGFAGRFDDPVTFYSFSSYTTPPSIYRLDLASGKSTLWRTPELSGFDPADYETRQVFYRSKDGTRVPMVITAHKGVKLDGDNPTILYGYGGFNIPILPDFSPAVAGWLAMGGVFAVANLRGGGEYGRAWHEAGMKLHKQNVFDDFAWAAKYLIAQKWTNPQRLAIRGASNGGLLVAATEEQHPELFAAAVPQVGVLDMLRFADFTVGKGWESDYGSVQNEAEFKAMLAYSPYQNVRTGVGYPATLVITGDHDDRVFPAHSFKFTAAMQHADRRGKPILIRIETRAGHGQGKPTAKQIDETVDVYAFILKAFGMAR